MEITTTKNVIVSLEGYHANVNKTFVRVHVTKLGDGSL